MSDQSTSNLATDSDSRSRLEAGVRRRQLPDYALEDDATSGEDVDLLGCVRVLHKRRWTAITAFVIVVGAVTVQTFTATPIFEAKTRLLIEAEEQYVVSFKQVVEERQDKADYYQTQYNILQSRALARRTLDQLALWDTPPFGGKSDNKVNVQKAVLGALGAAISGIVRLVTRDSDKDGTKENHIPAADETAAQSSAIDLFLGYLTVAPVRNSRLVDVKYTLPDAALATRIVNALAKSYIEQNLEYKFLASKEASDWLGARLAEERKKVEGAEAKLQQYREQNDAISLEDRQNIVVQRLADLNAAVTRAKTERIEKEAVYRQLRAAQADPARLDTFPAILTNSFLQQQKGALADLQREYAQLSEKLGDKHPDILKVKSAIELSQSKLNGEVEKIVQSVKSEYQAALAQENSLSGALNQQKAEALSLNRKAIDYGVLQRDLESSKQLYQNLMQRAKETGVAGELKTSNIRIVDLAERPRAPISPHKRTNLLLSVLTGLLLGCGLAFCFEYLDSRIKRPDEIRVHLGLQPLGLLPKVKLLPGTYPLVTNGAPADFREALRTLRTNVIFSSTQDGARSIVVTSTGPGEGKSVVASNLAIALANSGHRVLLLDADMRKPKIHEIFKCSQEPGLSNLIVGQAKASEVVSKSLVPGLWVLPAGRIPPNGAELLGSQRSRQFLSSLKEHFDWIIVDSPPVMAVADAVVMAHEASGVLFVVGSEMTSRHLAKHAVESLDQGRARFVGAVLNRVNLKRNGYYYSQYYRREYTQYYAKCS